MKAPGLWARSSSPAPFPAIVLACPTCRFRQRARRISMAIYQLMTMGRGSRFYRRANPCGRQQRPARKSRHLRGCCSSLRAFARRPLRHTTHVATYGKWTSDVPTLVQSIASRLGPQAQDSGSGTPAAVLELSFTILYYCLWVGEDRGPSSGGKCTSSLSVISITRLGGASAIHVPPTGNPPRPDLNAPAEHQGPTAAL